MKQRTGQVDERQIIDTKTRDFHRDTVGGEGQRRFRRNRRQWGIQEIVRVSSWVEDGQLGSPNTILDVSLISNNAAKRNVPDCGECAFAFIDRESKRDLTLPGSFGRGEVTFDRTTSTSTAGPRKRDLPHNGEPPLIDCDIEWRMTGPTPEMASIKLDFPTDWLPTTHICGISRCKSSLNNKNGLVKTLGSTHLAHYSPAATQATDGIEKLSSLAKTSSIGVRETSVEVASHLKCCG